MQTASSSTDIPAESIEKTAGPSGRGVLAVGQTLASRILMQAINAGTGVLTARVLMPSGRGELAAITLWSQFLAGLVTFGLPSALIYHIRRNVDGAKDLLINGLVMSTIFSIGAAIVGAVLMPKLLHQYPLWAIRSAQWFLLITPLSSTAVILRGALEASGKFTTSNLAQLLNPSVTLGILLLLLAVHRFNTFTASLAYILAAFPVFFLLLWKARDLLSRDVLPGVQTSKLLLSYGLRSYGIDLLGTLALQVDQVLVVSILRPRDLGVYVVMLSLSRILNVFQSSVVMVLFPRSAGRTLEEVVALTGRAARVSTLITGLCAAMVAIAGPWLLRLFYGQQYAQEILSLRLLLIEVTLSGCVFVLAQAFMALGRPGTVTLLQAIGLGLSVPLMLWLIPRWGIRGAAASLLLSTGARFIFMYSSFRWILRSPLPPLTPKREDWLLLRNAINRLRRTEAA